MNNIKVKSKLLLIIFIVILGIGLIIFGYIQSQKKEEKKVTEEEVTINEDLIKDQEVDGFSFTKTSLAYQNGMSYLVTSVYNNSEDIKYIKSFNIIIKDKNNNVIETMLGYIGEEIPGKETRQITSISDLDLSKAASIEYTINKE